MRWRIRELVIWGVVEDRISGPPWMSRVVHSWKWCLPIFLRFFPLYSFIRFLLLLYTGIRDIWDIGVNGQVNGWRTDYNSWRGSECKWRKSWEGDGRLVSEPVEIWGLMVRKTDEEQISVFGGRPSRFVYANGRWVGMAMDARLRGTEAAVQEILDHWVGKMENQERFRGT